MNYYLVKSEPFKYSWTTFAKDKTTFWDGVRNYQARNTLRDMKIGDKVLFYHSNEGLEIVGIATVHKESYQDPTTEDNRWVVVDLTVDKKLENPVSLHIIKQDSILQDMALVKQSRLSVMPVTTDQFHRVLLLSNTEY